MSCLVFLLLLLVVVLDLVWLVGWPLLLARSDEEQKPNEPLLFACRMSRRKRQALSLHAAFIRLKNCARNTRSISSRTNKERSRLAWHDLNPGTIPIVPVVYVTSRILYSNKSILRQPKRSKISLVRESRSSRIANYWSQFYYSTVKY